MSDKDQTQVSTATDAGDAGYNKALKNRHIQMIAIGGSIGTGLFLGAGGRLAQGGPALAFAYAVCGVFAFLMVREGRVHHRLVLLPGLGRHRHG